ncbi:MAG TPA: trigger factor [Bacteroidota bacterium]|nr:trigger factor [Bacteroidota bacterium]
MEVLIKSKSDVAHEIEINVPYEELAPHFEKAYREEARNITLPGFRRGKVPMQIIRKRFGQAIEYQVIEKLSNDFFKTALEERNITPIGQPVLHDMDYEPGSTLSIKVDYETAPEVVAKDYTGLQLERLVHTVTEEELDDEILALRKSRRQLEPADKPEDESFLVTIDIQMLDAQGEVIPGKGNDNMKVDLSDDNVNSDLASELYNLSVGEEKDVEFTHQHEDHEHVERWRIKVLRVERSTLPELDDAFAKEISNGEAESVDALRTVIRGRLEDLWRDRYERQLENDLVNEIIKHNHFDIPPSLLNSILDDMVKDLTERQPGKRLPDDFNHEEYRKYRTGEAEFIARWMFLRDSISELEGIKLEDEDVLEKARKDSEVYGIPPERLVEFYKSSPQYTQNILVEKLLRFLLASAEIKEVDDNDISHVGTTPLSFQDAMAQHEHGHDHDHDHAHDAPVEDEEAADADSSTEQRG